MKLTDMSGKPSTKQMARVTESRFGFKIDYSKLTLHNAYRMATSINEGLSKIQHSHGIHSAEKNPQYMELMMVRESIHSWMRENQRKFMIESAMGKSEAILAAKDMVDSVQDMLEKIGKMQNEQMPALLDTVRDQIGQAEGEQFRSVVSPLLMELAHQLQAAREIVDGAARGLAGEPQDQAMGMSAPAEPDLGTDPTQPATADEPVGDEFGATDAAAGMGNDLGREMRESRVMTKKKSTSSTKAKPDFLDLDQDGNKKEPMKKAAAGKKAMGMQEAKPDFLDLDQDGNKKEPMKRAAASLKKAK